MTSRFLESAVEGAALEWLSGLGYTTPPSSQFSPGEAGSERSDPGQVVLQDRLKQALSLLNPSLPREALEDAFRHILTIDGPSQEVRNRSFHRMLVDGVTVEYTRPDGTIAGAQARLIDYESTENNDWLAVNQFTIIENKHNRRPDIILFVNGLPLVVFELKNATDENATIENAFTQMQTYEREIPSLFNYNALQVISDGMLARVGTITSGWEWFKPWKTIEGADLASSFLPELQVLLEGIFEKHRFLDLIRHFLVFEESQSGLVKKMAGYHQFHAVNLAVAETIRACSDHTWDLDGSFMGRAAEGLIEPTRMAPGDKRIGVVWHTQGSGKSLTMVFYAGRIIMHPEMSNPTIVVITDRNDLDDQLFGTFGRCSELLRQPPDQVRDRADLRTKLTRDSGGVIFTTIHKFLPEEKGDRLPVLSDRRNIVVIADEAHRSQYDFVDGFARHMHDALPNASFIGFTGTPIELADKNTRAVFGEYISIYDIQRAVEDGATVPIYYEGRLAKLALLEEEKPRIDPEFEEATEGEEVERKEKLKTRWAQLEAVVGADKRITLIARDLVDHFEKRLEAIDGKAMVVCMSRRICIELHDAIKAIRPGWFSDDDTTGFMKVIMTGSASDDPDWQQHIRNKPRREALANRFRDPKDPFKLVIVRDMWLTGFDAPSLHTMYIDKPMRGHGLMQAIARVNRVFKDKPGGLIVDYLGLADELRRALGTYTESGGKGSTAISQAEAVAIMQEKYEICLGIFHGFDWTKWISGAPAERLYLLPSAQEHVLAQPDGKARTLKAVTDLSQAFALAVPHEEALAIRDDLGFFQAVRAVLVKNAPGQRKTDADLDQAIRQIVSKAVASDEVVDIFSAAGLKKPDISILSDEFLTEVKGMPHRNLAIELLRKLLEGEIRDRQRKNVVEARSFTEMLEQTIRRYQNRALETAQIIEELIHIAQQFRESSRRGDDLGLTDDELAFYDALEANDSAVKVLGDETLRTIARELTQSVRNSVTIDWKVRENVRAQIRVLVKRILRKHGYPPDKQEKATQTVLEQAEVLSEGWVA
jgi:type I restriction enzyme, R subunit